MFFIYFHIINVCFENKLENSLKPKENLKSNKLKPKPKSKNPSSSNLIDKLRDKIPDTEDYRQSDSLFECNIRKYLFDESYSLFDSDDVSNDILDYYNNFKKSMPILSEVARLILHTVASSVPCECIFSHVIVFIGIE